MIDLQMAQAAMIQIQNTQTDLQLSQEVTGLPNPNSLTDLKKYIKDRTGKRVASITKGNMAELQENAKAYPDVELLK